MRISRRRLLQAAGASVVFGRAGSPSAGVTSNASEQRWSFPAERGFRVIEHCWIPMADGVRLSARLWLPTSAAGETVPAVFEYIPYRKRDHYRFIDDIWGPALASRGIAYARVDVRGSGDSEGVFTDEYSEPELHDGEQCIAWLARQSWCNGAVGMRGISWGGINTLQIASRRPPALKAIMPMGCCDNRFTDDAHYVGGALGHTNFQWGNLFKLVMAGPPDPAIVGTGWEKQWRQRLEAAPPILSTWLRHQRFDNYWKRGSVALDYAAIQCSVYIVDGWQDTYANPVGRLLEKLQSPRKGLIGPWGHTYPYLAQPLGLDWAQEEVRWWYQWLKGADTGIMQEPMFRAFMPYSTARESLPAEIPGRWIAEAQWPPTTAPTIWHLNAGELSPTPGEERSLTYHAKDIVGLTKPEWLDRLPIEQSTDDAKSLCFDSATLNEDLEILGYPRAHLKISVDAPLAKVAVRVTEVTPDGRSWLITYGLLNLTHRDSHAEPSVLVPGQSCDVDIPMFMIAHRFKRGSRIRVAVSENLWPLAWPSPSIVTLSLTSSACTLTLPVRAMEKSPAELPFPVVRQANGGVGPAAYTPIKPDAKGRFVIDNDVPASTFVVPGVGTIVGREIQERSEIVAGDPLSNRWQQHARSTYKRGDWNCQIDSEYSITATATEFHLSETLRASKDGKEIFKREARNVIPRDMG